MNSYQIIKHDLAYLKIIIFIKKFEFLLVSKMKFL